jgi:Fe-S cluster assembly ATPase SufC
MTMNRLMKNIARNSVYYMEQGEVAKSQACIEVIAFIRERGYDNIRGNIELSVDNS